MGKRKIPLEDLSTLRKSLPWGCRKKIAEITGTTLRHVTLVLYGNHKLDMKVINAAIDYNKKYKAEREEVIKKIRKATKTSWIKRFLQKILF